MADPGFPRGGGANSPGGRGAPTYDFAKFSQKNCMKLKEFGPPGGGGGARPKFYYVDPPLNISAIYNENDRCCLQMDEKDAYNFVNLIVTAQAEPKWLKDALLTRKPTGL